jgi:uncharacterized RDD family membrane protein YckC
MRKMLRMKASFWRRFAACAVDSVSSSILAAILAIWLGLPSDLEYWFHFALFYASRILLEYRCQASLGNMIFSLRLKTTGGNNPSLFECIYRNLAQFFSSLPLGYGYLRILAPHQPQTVHDEAARCYVIDIRRMTRKPFA